MVVQVWYLERRLMVMAFIREVWTWGARIVNINNLEKEHVSGMEKYSDYPKHGKGKSSGGIGKL